MATIIASGLPDEIPINELKAATQSLDVRAAMRYVTTASCLLLRGKTEHHALVNGINLPLLAKAFGLWAQIDGGRPLHLTGYPNDEGGWFLHALNSLPWRSVNEPNLDETMVSWLIRQAYIRYATDDPLDARIARTWMMFHDLVQEGGLAVANPSEELRRLIGVSAEDLWVLGMAMWGFHVITTSTNAQKWLFDPDLFVREGPHQHEVNETLRRTLSAVARTPQQLRQMYDAASSKYRDPESRDKYWMSEFNILRDFPVVAFGDGTYCAPFPTYALTRAIDGFYFDLVEDYAEKARLSGRRGNPYDNEMTATLGTLFQRYVGRQLEQLAIPDGCLLPEFKYGPRKSRKDSPDWLLLRPGAVPIFVECKARQPSLDVQRYASTELLISEAKAALSKACGQLAKFVAEIGAREPGLDRFFGQEQFVCVVVTPVPFPFHMIPDVRSIIEGAASGQGPAWEKYRKQILLVPMSIRELETVVAAEITLGVPVEEQLVEYAHYRATANRIEGWDGIAPIFPRHIEEWLQERLNNSRRIVNPLCTKIWQEFTDYCQRRIFGESIADTVTGMKISMTHRLAYDLWEKRGGPLCDDLRDWFEAERILGSLLSR
ncbi:MAG: DUF2934 domain-containing protein [Planctomycetaceae bacterium]|nr:DUF2934 domain-containing protein [Planctomycetaceae bacterium]